MSAIEVVSPIKSVIPSGLCFGHLNVCSLFSKTLSIYSLLQEFDIDIMSLNETWLNCGITNANLYLPGYCIFRLDRSTRGGGVSILVSNKYKSVHENVIMSPSIELLHITLELCCTAPINIISIYRPPLSSIPEFFIQLKQFLNNITYNIHPLVICGDLNINVLNKSSSSTIQLLDLLKDYGFMLFGNNATRVTLHSATCIDVIIGNSLAIPYLNSYQTISNGISDHETIIFGYKKTKKCILPPVVTVHKLMDGVSMDKCQESIASLDIDNYLGVDGVNDTVNNYMADINHIIHTNIKIKVRRMQGNHHPWINAQFIKMARSRDKLFHLAKRQQSPTLLHLGKQLRNKCNSLSRKLKKEYFENSLTLNKNNPKKVWKLLKPLYSNKAGTTTIDKICVDGEQITTPTDISCNFNTYFIKVVNDLHQSFGTFTIGVLLPVPCSFQPFVFSTVDILTVKSILLRIRKHGRSDSSIHIKLISYCADIFASHLTTIINTIFDQLEFPLLWKKSDVVPIYKSGSHSDISNYRPISILPNLSKVIERIMHQQILAYLEQHNLLPRCQHGFRPYHSTASCALEFINFVYEGLDKGHFVISIFIDFSKAFDLLSHDILIRKLRVLHFSESAIQLIKSYLEFRVQRVFCNGAFSQSLPVSHGVPQGSILGPLLFILYIHDMKDYLQHSYILQYADDTTLCVSSTNLSSLVNNLNADMQSIEQYCQSNMLVLNVAKTKAMLFSGRKDYNPDILNLSSNGFPIEFVANFKYLGIHIDNKLTFIPHIHHVIKKLTSAGYVLAKCRNFLPRHILVLLFNAIGLSHINFGAVIYLAGCNKKSFQQVESRYVDCGRIILSNKRGSSRSATMLALNWSSLENITIKSMLLFLYKVIHCSKPAGLYMLLKSLPHQHSTRLSKFGYFIPHIQSDYGKHSFTYWAPHMLNTTSINISSFKSLPAFEHYLSAFLSTPNA